MAQTRPKDWRGVTSSRQARFGRSAGQPQAGRRFARSSPQTAQPRRFGRNSARAGVGGVGRTRRRQPERSGAQGLLQNLKSVLPGGSSGKRGGRSAVPGVGGLLSSFGGAKAGRGRKPALLGLLGAGAAGAAVVAKRRKGSGSSEVSGAPQQVTAEPRTAAEAPAEATPAPPRTEYPTTGGGESA